MGTLFAGFFFVFSSDCDGEGLRWVKKEKAFKSISKIVFECFKQRKGDSSSKLERFHLARVVELVQCQFAMSGAKPSLYTPSLFTPSATHQLDIQFLLRIGHSVGILFH